jgi:hypothetical protein
MLSFFGIAEATGDFRMNEGLFQRQVIIINFLDDTAGLYIGLYLQ